MAPRLSRWLRDNIRDDGTRTPRPGEKRGAAGNLPWGDSTPPTNGMLGSPTAGTYINEASALQISTVFACTSLLADAVATLPIKQFRGVGPSRKEIPLAPVVADPFMAELTQQDWLTQGMFSQLLRGNFYGHVVERDDLLYPLQIKPVHPDQVRVRRRDDGAPEYRFNGDIMPLDDVFHIRAYSVPGSLVGLSQIEMARNTMGLARASELYAGSFYANSALPNGVISVPGELEPDEAAALIRQWNQMHQGIGQANLPGVLTGGMTFQPITMNANDSQFIQSRELSRLEIMMLFRIPPHMLGDVDRTTSWGVGIEQQELGFVRMTLSGWLKRFTTAWNRVLPPGQYVEFDLSERLRGDTLQRFQAWQLAVTNGWMSRNEVRSYEGQEKIDDPKGDEYTINSAMIPLGGQPGDTSPSTNPPNGAPPALPTIGKPATPKAA